MHLFRPRLLMFALLALALAGGLFWRLRPEPVAVRLVKAAPGLVERSVSNTRAGAIMACQRARLAPSSGGQIAAIYARKGDRVMQDELLIELWNLDLKAELELAQQQLSASGSSAHAVRLTAAESRREADRPTQ
ncbi:MAG: efflux RND transporter periplasmic adaptor subunit, partial [Gammaproteobacteria bacterium]|nr:efflux RND transporter periplasmic adaptor subunit [Gammaproteobacteria bacterium]